MYMYMQCTCICGLSTCVAMWFMYMYMNVVHVNVYQCYLIIRVTATNLSSPHSPQLPFYQPGRKS